MSQEKVEGFKATEPKIKNPTMSDARQELERCHGLRQI